MLQLLTKRIKYSHLKVIHQNLKGVNNRHKQTADKWVKSLKHQHIKTYYDLFLNKEVRKYDIKYFINENEDQVIKKTYSAINPSLALLKQQVTLFKPERADDKQLARDIDELTIFKFIQEGRNNLSDVHVLVLSFIGAVFIHALLYFTFLYGKQLPKSERVTVLNTQITESYNFEGQELDIKKIKERIEIVNQEYQRVLNETTQAKTKH